MNVGFIGGKFLPLHLGHVYAILKASTMVDKLYVVLSHSKKRDEELCKRDGCKQMPHQIRLSWLHQLAKHNPHIIPLAVEDEFGNEDYDWELGSKLIKNAIPEKIDVIFGSEPKYKSIFKKFYPKAQYIIIDAQRKQVPISATQLRKNIFKHWHCLPEFVQPFFVKKIVLVGTESCGKTTLTKNLAHMYNTTYVEEYGRTLCEKSGGPETLIEHDYRRILYGHKLKEHKKAQSANKIVFIDTEAIVTKYYAHLYNNYKDKLFDEIIKHQNYDLWLYLEPDTAWADDGQRRHGEKKMREQNNKRLKSLLRQHGVTYTTISGSYTQRLELAMKKINSII